MAYRFFMALGVLFLVFGTYLTWQRTTPLRLAFGAVPQTHEAKSNIPVPVALAIPAANIKLPIIPSVITQGKWGDTKEGISYLKTSPVPGERGNSIMYGHNWPNLLGNLVNVRPGDKLTVTLSDGKRVNFTAAFVFVVTPDQTHILADSNDTRLTIYTCTGLFDSKRLVVTAVAS